VVVAGMMAASSAGAADKEQASLGVVESIRDRVTAIRTQLDRERARCAGLAAERDQLQGDVEALTTELARAEARGTELDGQILSLKQEVGSLEQTLAKERAASKAFRAEAAETQQGLERRLQAEVKRAAKREKEFQKEVAGLSSRIEKLDQSLASERKVRAGEGREAKETIARLEAEQKRQQMAAGEQAEKSARELAAATSRIKGLEKDLAATRASAQDLEKTLADVRKARTESEAVAQKTVAGLKQEIASLKKAQEASTHEYEAKLARADKRAADEEAKREQALHRAAREAKVLEKELNEIKQTLDAITAAFEDSSSIGKQMAQATK
jgi:chromosome segregation ATPase